MGLRGGVCALVGEQVLVALNAIREDQIRIDASGGYLTTPAPRFLQTELFSFLGVALFSVIGISWVMFVARRVASYRRATGVRRQQFKWVMCGSAITATAIPMFAFVSVTWIQPFAGAAVAALPIAIGVGILRYRLYEIDVIIRKTLVYAILVGSLAVVYLGGIYLIDRALQALTGQSGALAVTVSTLAVAAAFQPLRARIQRAVDHRFYRQKYDAIQTLETFTSRLRDQIELDALSAGVIEVVNTTLQPRHASLWLRPPTPPPGNQPRPSTDPNADKPRSPMTALRKVHGGFVYVFAFLIVIQFFLAGLGAFETVHDKKFNDDNFGPHGILGTLLVLIALLIMILALIGRWTPTTTKLSAALFGLMVIQLILGVSGADSSPILGGLHAVNALVIVATTYLLVKDARHPLQPPARSTA